MNLIRSNFCRNVNYLRRKKGLTQFELAADLGITKAMIGTYEENRCVAPYEVLVEYSDYFEVSIDELLKTEVRKLSKEKE